LEKWLWKKLIIKKTTHFVCISKFIAGTLQAISPNINKFSIIYNIPTDRKVQCEESLPVSDPNVFTVLYVGQISKIKGVDLLYDAAIQLLKSELNVRFIFAGQLFQSTLYTEISESQDYETFKSKIVFTDRIQNVSHLYSISDILVVPSVVEEALSNVVGEAKLAGCPAIVFPSGGLPELINHNLDGYICKNKSTDELIFAISQYYYSPSMLQAHRENALSSIKKLGLTHEIFSNKWMSIYSQTI
jgi:glycosyltransferase involved in cell wall biosynthesis